MVGAARRCRSAAGRSAGWGRAFHPRLEQKACQPANTPFFADFGCFMAAGLLDFAQLAQVAGDYPAACAGGSTGGFI
ncbi:hypothetical protein AvCA_22340 [Azotobacter vinelandii CA]|uniref:Uncharacterized protein n=2 Tax=Azotobacter vinelandii TaxID=354 RepID=C1DGB4_AZOVD|nr:hypothetical protein Avin_22340 [Azotobacter vinelandii DJ]AGK15023.1 hypothetical protein AvCA_22340 [Azotobacter vinelandii CA]AGK20494.1 hypothetical protein AvCA6_22340 [Azotobacter vinelandii CA6]